ncbi:MAG: DUF4252 domain-containing protein [Bryobacteraceae bacterium]|jgi:hypothetical protein
MKIAMLALAAAMLPACAQDIKLPVNLDALADKADEAVTVTMDKSMLKLAGKFLNDKDGDDADVRKLLAGLDSIYVRSFQFSHEGQYNMADVEALRTQLQGPVWGRLVGVRSKHSENVDVYFKDGGNGQLGGIVVIAAEPKELTIVHIIGTLDPEKLADLGGEFGIPRLERSSTWRKAR